MSPSTPGNDGGGVRSIRSASTAGLAAQLAVLAALAATVGLSGPGALVGLAYGGAVVGLLARGLRRAGSAAPGPADLITLVRAVLVGGVAALVAGAFAGSAPAAAPAGLAAAALLLDGVDGRVARATGTVSTVGARFDVEVDAALVLVLSLYAARELGPWVVLLGSLHYLLGGARLALPWLRRSAPPRSWCKVVAAVQGVVLVVVASGVLPPILATTALLVVGVLLAESFGREVRWLFRTRGPVPALIPVPALGSVRG
jgi:phosphatidylglycerophosphate synthase